MSNIGRQSRAVQTSLPALGFELAYKQFHLLCLFLIGLGPKNMRSEPVNIHEEQNYSKEEIRIPCLTYPTIDPTAFVISSISWPCYIRWYFAGSNEMLKPVSEGYGRDSSILLSNNSSRMRREDV